MATSNVRRSDPDQFSYPSRAPDISRKISYVKPSPIRQLVINLFGNQLTEDTGKNAEVEALVDDQAIQSAYTIALKVYKHRLPKEEVAPSQPSLEQVQKAFSLPAQKEGIARRTEPKLCLTIVAVGDDFFWQPALVDGAQEMPLETYADKDVNTMTRAERILESRAMNKDLDITELDEKIELYGLLAILAAKEGKPIDQGSLTMLSANFEEGDRHLWYASYFYDLPCFRESVSYVRDNGCRLRFAVMGSVIA